FLKNPEFKPFRFQFYNGKQKILTMANSQILEAIGKGQKSIRALEIQSTLPTHVMHEFPTLWNLFYLHLNGVRLPKESCQWLNATKFPNLRALAVNNLDFIPACNADIDTLNHLIEKATIYNDSNIHFKFGYSRYDVNKDVDKVRFLNAILMGCPNLISLAFINDNDNMSGITLSSSGNASMLLMPPSLEWLYVESLMQNCQIDFTQCKAIAGLHLISSIPFFVEKA
ncbi:hypothetical protein RFI_24158, partial [Reticulomyxa filosa]